MKKTKYKMNLKKIKRNVFILLFLILTALYIGKMQEQTENKIESVQAFTEYAKEHGIALTDSNYKEFMKK